jgi:hypothetical protein
MPSNPAYGRKWRESHPDYSRARRTSLYGPPATPEEQAACLSDPRKSLESRFGIVTSQHVLCMFCWHRYQELDHHLPKCAKPPAEWDGKTDIVDFYRRHLEWFNQTTPLMCEALRQRRAKIADDHSLGEYAKADPNRKELLGRIRPVNVGRKHSRQARLNKGDRR